MAEITAHTVFSDSIDVAIATGELRSKAQLEAEFTKEYETYAFSNFDAFDLELKILTTKLDADVQYLASIFKKTLVEKLLSIKEQIEKVIAELDAAIIKIDGNIIARKTQLSEIEKFRAFVSKEENIARKRNVDFGMLLSYAKTTAGYLSYVLTVAPDQLTNTSATSPLTRFKLAKDELKNALLSYGYNGVNGSTVMNELKTLVAEMDTSITALPMPRTVDVPKIIDNTYVFTTIQQSVIDFKNLDGLLSIAALTLPKELVLKYYNTFAIENQKRGETVLAVEAFQQKVMKSLIELMLTGREEIRKQSIGAAAKMQGYRNEIQKKKNDIALKTNQLAEAEAKIGAGAKDIIARIAAVQNFYDNLLRQGTEIMGSYANSVVSSVPTQASDVIAEFKEFLDMQQKEIDVRI